MTLKFPKENAVIYRSAMKTIISEYDPYIIFHYYSKLTVCSPSSESFIQICRDEI